MSERRRRQQQVKKKISQILLSVKQQKQHIENQLGRNDRKINEYCQEYQELRYQNDFSQLSLNQKRLLSSISLSLSQSGINPIHILGNQAKGLIQDSQYQNKLDGDQILLVQQKIIKNLISQIQKIQQN